MAYDTLLYEKHDHIATVTINRPEKRNAWSVRLSEEIIEVFSAMEDDPEVLVTLLTGKGIRLFLPERTWATRRPTGSPP